MDGTRASSSSCIGAQEAPHTRAPPPPPPPRLTGELQSCDLGEGTCCSALVRPARSPISGVPVSCRSFRRATFRNPRQPRAGRGRHCERARGGGVTTGLLLSRWPLRARVPPPPSAPPHACSVPPTRTRPPSSVRVHPVPGSARTTRTRPYSCARSACPRARAPRTTLAREHLRSFRDDARFRLPSVSDCAPAGGRGGA